MILIIEHKHIPSRIDSHVNTLQFKCVILISDAELNKNQQKTLNSIFQIKA
ncbi:hypothetical protein Hanom_Chr17g01526241 [Helianthus anomalus]